MATRIPDSITDSSMTGTLVSQVAIILGILAVGSLAIMLLRSTHKPKGLERADKAEIMRQLLALSERENNLVPATPRPRQSKPLVKKASHSKPPVRSKSR